MNWVSISSGNGSSPVRRQAITQTNPDLLSFEPSGTNFSQIWINIQDFHSRKCIWKKSSVKWRPFYHGKWVNTIRWLLLVFQSWYPVMQSSLYNSFDDWAPVHEICGSLIFKWDPLNRRKFRAPVLWDIPCWTHKLHEKRQKCDEQIDKAIPIPYPTTLAGVKKITRLSKCIYTWIGGRFLARVALTVAAMCEVSAQVGGDMILTVTRTIRTPAFWDTRSQVKRRQSQSYKV